MGHRRHALKHRYGQKKAGRLSHLTVFERHELEVARAALNTPEELLGMFDSGPRSHAEAREVIRRLIGK